MDRRCVQSGYHVDKWADERPDNIFMVAPEPGLTLTFSQLQSGCVTYGKHLLKLGFKKDDKISFMMGNSYQTTKIFLAAMYSGFVISPLNLNAQPSQLTYVLNHSDTKLVFVTDFQHDRLLESLVPVQRNIEVIVIDKNREEIFPHEDLADWALPDITEEDPALLLYTSGTTGRPKGAILTQKNMVSGGHNVVEAHRLSADDTGLVSLPLYHINAEVVSVMAPLVGGSSIVMPERFSASQFWPLLSQYRCTWFSVVPTIISYLVSGTDIAGKGYHLDQIRFGRSASSALPPSLHQTFEKKFNISLVETMGLTEMCCACFLKSDGS